jgi:hypothetical protein
MIERVISGGQTGVDQAGLRAARAAGIATGGFAPKGWLIESEDGRHNVPAPWLAEYGLVECPEPGYGQVHGRRLPASAACLTVYLVPCRPRRRVSP